VYGLKLFQACAQQDKATPTLRPHTRHLDKQRTLYWIPKRCIAFMLVLPSIFLGQSAVADTDTKKLCHTLKRRGKVQNTRVLLQPLPTKRRAGASLLLSTCVIRVGQNHIYTVYTRYFWQGNHQIYGHIRCIYTVLPKPMCDVWVTQRLHFIARKA